MSYGPEDTATVANLTRLGGLCEIASNFKPAKESHMRSLARVVPSGFALLLVIGFSAAAPVEAARPKTIPALKSWTDGGASYTFTPSARIVLDSAYSGTLGNTGSALSTDLLYLSGWSIPVVNGS